MTGSRRVATRAGWSIADQVLSSIINFGLGISVARVGSPSDFGAYGLVFSAYLIAINVSRPLGIEPLIIRFTGKPTDVWRTQLSAASGVVLMVGLALGAVAIGVGISIELLGGDTHGMSFIVLGIGLAGLVLQDGWRLSFFAEGRGRDAFFNDVVWAIVSFSIGASLLSTGGATVVTLIGAWVIGANVAALVGIVRVGVRPRPGRVIGWWFQQRDLARPLLAEHLITNIANEAIPYLIGAIAGLTAVAALRAAQLLLGPFNVVFQALGLIALPEAVRIAERSRVRLLEAAAVFSGGLVVAVLVVGFVVSALPDPIGTTLLGSTWEIAQEVMIPYTLLIAGTMAAAGPMVGLRALGEALESLIVGGTRSVLSLVGAVIGATAAGAPGAALGMAIGHWVGAVGTWWRFVVRVGGRRPPA